MKRLAICFAVLVLSSSLTALDSTGAPKRPTTTQKQSLCYSRYYACQRACAIYDNVDMEKLNSCLETCDARLLRCQKRALL